MEELARRAVACKGWRWMPGMACVHPKTGERFRLTDNNWCDEDGIYADPETEEAPCIAYDSGPDLTDPATLGCLLALVREAYSMRLWLASSRDGDMWYVDAASGALAHGSDKLSALLDASATLKYLIEEAT